jgi:CubicO group peptidase (beta-lactamase class C family)
MKLKLYILGLIALAAAASAEAGGKMLFILSGQSNMQGMNERLTFVPRVQEEYGENKVLIVKEAVGGRPIRMWVHDWAPAPGWSVDPDIPNTEPPSPEENGVMYDSMMEKIVKATRGEKPEAIAFCWMQGERDARERHSAVYEKSLRKLFRQLEDDFPETPIVFVIGRLSDFGQGNSEPFYPEWDEVRAAQEHVADSMPNCALIDTDDLNTGDSPPHWETKEISRRVDDLHMSAEGYRIMGTRFAEESIKLLEQIEPAENDGTAPEVTDLNAEDISYAREKEIPDLKHAFVNTAPEDRRDGIAVGELNAEQEKQIRAFAREIFIGDHGAIDSLLIAKDGKLVFESYYRRGRINYPHYQMSITKSYTAMAIGRAIQLGRLSMDDLDKPAISFLQELDRSTLADGAEKITLAEAMNMRSGIRIDKELARKLMKQPEQLRGQGQIQAYLQHSAPIPDAPREFKYQGADPSITMQVLESVLPGSAEAFIKTEVLGKLGIDNYHWEHDVSGLPKSAAGSSMRSRDMLKWGLLIMDKGKWNGEQLIPAEFIERAVDRLHTNPRNHSYGYFWWRHDAAAGQEGTHDCISGRGAGGQFILIFPEAELVAVITAHNQGMGNMLKMLPARLLPILFE